MIDGYVRRHDTKPPGRTRTCLAYNTRWEKVVKLPRGAASVAMKLVPTMMNWPIALRNIRE
jgi:hypothetical protein